jgi:curved DNA-binding protein CbpA
LPTLEECYRQLLGLPLGRRLSGVEIHQAYKRVAKTAHPDAGGNAREFLELSAARDALMKER